MIIEVKKAKITSINIKDAFKLTIDVEHIPADNIAELARYINADVKLTISDDQTQLPGTEE
jgi:hypothetical protein